MTDSQPTPDDYADGVSDVMESVFGSGLMVSATGGERSKNPYPVDSADWREWQRGFQAWEEAPKIEIEIEGISNGQ